MSSSPANVGRGNSGEGSGENSPTEGNIVILEPVGFFGPLEELVIPDLRYCPDGGKIPEIEGPSYTPPPTPEGYYDALKEALKSSSSDEACLVESIRPGGIKIGRSETDVDMETSVTLGEKRFVLGVRRSDFRTVPHIPVGEPRDSKDSRGLDRVPSDRDFEPVKWIDPDIRSTEAHKDWRSDSAMRSLEELYEGREFASSNMSFDPCIPSERVCSFDNRRFFMFFGSVMVKLGVRPPFTPFQKAILRRLDVAPSQLNYNAWLMLVCFEFLCAVLGNLRPTPSIFFHFFSHSSRSRGAFVYFTQRQGVTRLFTGVPSSSKGWRDSFFRVSRKGLDKRAGWMSTAGKMTFPVTWSVPPKAFPPTHLEDLSEEDRLVGVILAEHTEEPWPILDVLRVYCLSCFYCSIIY